MNHPHVVGWAKGMVVFRRHLRAVQRISPEMIGIVEGDSIPGGEGKRAAHDLPADPRVDAYIDGLPDWQQDICREVRDLVHAADPEVAETIKRTDRPYFVLDGNICALLAAKDHVNVFLYDGAIVPDPEGIITARPRQQDRPDRRRHEGETINAPALTRDVPADHRQQPGRRLAQDQGRPVRRGSLRLGSRNRILLANAVRDANGPESRAVCVAV